MSAATTGSTTGSRIRREWAAVLFSLGRLGYRRRTRVVVLGDLNLPQILALLTITDISYLPKGSCVLVRDRSQSI